MLRLAQVGFSFLGPLIELSFTRSLTIGNRPESRIRVSSLEDVVNSVECGTTCTADCISALNLGIAAALA